MNNPCIDQVILLVRKAAAEFNKELQIIAVETHLLLSSMRDGDPN